MKDITKHLITGFPVKCVLINPVTKSFPEAERPLATV